MTTLRHTWPSALSAKDDPLKTLSTLQPNAKAMTNGLPMLPGFNFSNARRTDFRRTHTLEYCNGVRMPSSPKKRPLESIPGRKKISASDIQEAHPTWTTLTDKVLRFFCYYKEGVHERQEETFRVRRCNLYYYLEDDTMQITEPRQENSGLPQGNVLKRHRVLRSPGSEEYFTVDDFDIGQELCIYNRVYRLVDCDAFTRDFYSKLDKPLGAFEEYPEDPFSESMLQRTMATHPQRVRDVDTRNLKRYMEYSVAGSLNLYNKDEKEAARNFYENDRKALQFKALWDDRGTLHGDARHFTLYYFLADGTIKVVEEYLRNCGRDPFPVFWQKQRLPKAKCPAADRNLETQTIGPQEYVSDQDLGVGKHISVCGRDILLYDCDEFTRLYYRQTYGIETPAAMHISSPSIVTKKPEPPPHFGPGSPEDSLSSWTHLVMRPPRRDIKKLLDKLNDRVTFGGYLEAQPERRMVVVFHPADDTVGVFEKPGRSNGFLGGKFLLRQRVKKPLLGNATLSQEAPYYGLEDFYVGSRLNVNSHIIVLEQIDEASIKYLEGAPKEFTVEDVNAVMQRIRSMMLTRYSHLRDFYRAMDRDHDGRLTIDELRSVCKELNMNLSDHELMCLMLYVDENHNGSVEYYEFVKKMAPRDYESDLSPNGGSIPLVQMADVDDHKYHQVAHSQAVQAESARAFKMFRDKLNAQRFVALDLFRIMSNCSFDATIGEQEFHHALQYKLQMSLTPRQIDLLRKRFFPFSGKRLTQQEFCKILDSAPHFETSYG